MLAKKPTLKEIQFLTKNNLKILFKEGRCILLCCSLGLGFEGAY